MTTISEKRRKMNRKKVDSFRQKTGIYADLLHTYSRA